MALLRRSFDPGFVYASELASLLVYVGSFSSRGNYWYLETDFNFLWRGKT